MYRITLIPGDGVGPEVIDAARRCVEATGLDVEWEVVYAGAEIAEKMGTPLPDEVLESIKRNRVALKGPITTPVGEGFRSVNVAIRKALDLYACVRPCKLYPGVRSPFKDVDLVVIRENTEDLYAGVEFQEGTAEALEFLRTLKEKFGIDIREDSGISLKTISRFCSARIVKFAFEYARKTGRKKVTAVHKANILKFSDGLFLTIAREIACDFPDIEFEDRIVDNMCMQLVQKPQLYDVIVAPNLYGDILSDLCAGLIGGLGMAPSANIGDKYAVFEPTHGSAPKYAGKDKVNPTAAILSAAMMLEHLGEKEKADIIRNAVAKVISEGKYVTYDLKPTPDDPTAVGTKKMTDAIIREIRERT
ncbi:MAG: isocitrate/isopropylmalate dehydrogenase family protein [Candidatus Hadarchaeales archaeon]